MIMKRRGATALLFLLALFLLTGFGLLAFRQETVDLIALAGGALATLYMIMMYNMLKAAFPHMDRMVLLCAEFMLSLGLLVIYRINPALATKQFICLLGGTLCMIIVMLLIRRSTNFGKWNWLFLGCTLLLLLSTVIFGRKIGGARNWLEIGPFSMQPSEFAKVFYIVVSAYFLSSKTRMVQLIPYLAFTAACVMTLVIAKDLGAALLIAGTFLIMFYTATSRLGLTLVGIGALGAGAIASYHLFSHVQTRVAVWKDPWASYNDQGYQIVQGLMALASGGLLGVGLGRGMPGATPASHTDYIFTVIGEEFGVLVGILVILFYLVFVVRGILIALNARSAFDAILVFGCTAMLALQSFIIIAGVIKLIPLTGITLPFISYGGSSVVASMAQLGVIEGVAIKNGKYDEEALKMMGGAIQ